MTRFKPEYKSLRLLAVLLAGIALVSCDRDPVAPATPPAEQPAPSASHVLGLVEVTFSGIGTQSMRASVRPVAPRSAPARSAPGAMTGGLHLSLTPLTSGDGTIQLEPVSTGSFTQGVRGSGGERYLYATFRVRNAQKDSVAYSDDRTNLTFLAVATGSTLDGTALSTLDHYDGSAADPTIAPTFLPTGLVHQSRSSELVSTGPDVLQVLTEAEAASFSAPSDVTSVFPYGFVVRNPNTPSSRTLPANPASGQFDGVVTFAYKVPLQATPADDPFTVSVMFLAVDDGTTRITQSPEEQDATAQAAFEQRAADLGATEVTLLSGGAYSGAIDQRTLCGVRVAGPVGAPTAVVGGTCLGARGVIYVDDDAAAGGNGTNWSSAYTDLQDALAVATPGDSIWVAAGTYTPGSARTATFQLRDGVTILGGFAGTETDVGARNPDPTTNGTILSGDVNGDDATGGNNGENSYHVTTASGTDASAVLDGFTITAGNANVNSGTTGFGAGMYDSGGSPTLRNLRILGNSAVLEGGGMYTTAGAAPTLSAVAFDSNSTFNDGGGMANDGSAPSITNSTFTGNTAGTYGGGLYDIGNSSPTLTDVAFTGNSSLHGGGMADLGGSTSTLRAVTFTANSATGRGGGMINEAGGDGVLVDVTFIANAANFGGGLGINGGNLKVENAKFLGDTARSSGGGVYVTSSSPFFLNTLFSGNTALPGSDGTGGGMSTSTDAVVTLANATFSGNSAAGAGTALNNGNNSQVTIAQSILWGDLSAIPGANEISNSTCGTKGCPTTIITYSIVAGAFDGVGGTWDTSLGTDVGNNLGSDPLFVDANGADDVFGTADDDLRLSTGSPAIDSGTNSLVPTDDVDLDNDGNTSETIPLDLGGGPRIVNTTVDRGAYERQP